MAKQSSQLPLVLPPREPGAPAFRWLYAALRAAILEGRLSAGARLPASRDLARQYHLSRGTILSAFEQLQSEGYVEPRIGSGTYVTSTLPGLSPGSGAAAPSLTTAQPPPPRRHFASYARRLHAFDRLDPGRVRAFRANLPALDLFPTALWAQTAARRWKRATPADLVGCEPLGYLPLREAVSGYLTTSRGVRCEPYQVAIVSGVQEALDLVARLFLEPGARAALEDPGYSGAALVFEACGAEVVAVGLDAEGIDLTDPQLAGARLVYVTPAHQFPQGVSMSLARRLALLEWARQHDGLIFEDDYDSEFRYSGRPLPALQGLDSRGQVLFAGSFSKVLFPSLRLGYLVVPGDLVDAVSAALSITHRHAPLIEQAIVADFMNAGHFGRHLRRMRDAYAERLATLLAAAKERWSGLLEISPVEAGLQTAGWLICGLDGAAAARAAAARDVAVSSLAPFARRSGYPEGLQIGFAAVSPEEIRRGVRELAIALELELTKAGRRAPTAT